MEIQMRPTVLKGLKAWFTTLDDKDLRPLRVHSCEFIPVDCGFRYRDPTLASYKRDAKKFGWVPWYKGELKIKLYAGPRQTEIFFSWYLEECPTGAVDFWAFRRAVEEHKIAPQFKDASVVLRFDSFCEPTRVDATTPSTAETPEKPAVALATCEVLPEPESVAVPVPPCPPPQVAMVPVYCDIAPPPAPAVHPGQLAAALEKGAWIRDYARRRPGGEIRPETQRVKTRLETLAAAGYLGVEWAGDVARVTLVKDW